MKIVIISLALIFITLPSSWSASMKIPTCITEMLYPVKDKPTWNQFIRVDSYLYQGKVVYLGTSDCCDQFNSLYDGDCNYICAPSGGFIGTGDGKCTDFSGKATPLGTVWTPPESNK